MHAASQRAHTSHRLGSHQIQARALTTSLATSSISSAFSLVNGRGISSSDSTALSPTRTSKHPLRGFSGLTVIEAEGKSCLIKPSSLVARVLNACQDLQASMITSLLLAATAFFAGASAAAGAAAFRFFGAMSSRKFRTPGENPPTAHNSSSAHSAPRAASRQFRTGGRGGWGVAGVLRCHSLWCLCQRRACVRRLPRRTIRRHTRAKSCEQGRAGHSQARGLVAPQQPAHGLCSPRSRRSRRCTPRVLASAHAFACGLRSPKDAPRDSARTWRPARRIPQPQHGTGGGRALR